MIPNKLKPRYPGWSHGEIIQHQREELRDVIRGSSGSIELDLNEPPDQGAREKIEAYTQGWVGEEEPERLVSAKGKSDTVRVEDTLYNYEAPLNLSKFILAGLGEAGRDCGKVVMTDVDIGENEDDIKQVKFKPLNCGRIECPTCYYEWAIRQTFEIALRVEAMALIRGERPFHVIFSIHPSKCEQMTWGNVNRNLWRRGVRHLEYHRCKVARDFETHKIEDCPNCWDKKIRCDKVGERGHNIEDCPDCYDEIVRCDIHKQGLDHKIEDCPECWDLDLSQYGGTGIFHPLRVRGEWKDRWGKGVNATIEDDLGSGKYWEKIRANIGSNAGKLEDFAKIGFHCHNWVFTDNPDRQENEEYVIKFCQNFKRFSRKEVVALTRYLVTHTATIREATVYRNHRCNYCGHSHKVNKIRCGHCGRTNTIEETHVVRNRIIHPIRSYGLLHRFDPKKELIKKFGVERGTKIYHKLAREIAELLYLRNEDGELITMVWNETTEELEYPAYAKEFVTTDEHTNWISIWKLLDLCREGGFLWQLSTEKREFVEDLLDYLRTEGKPPPIEDCGRSLSDVLIIPDSVAIVERIKVGDNAAPRRRQRKYSFRRQIVELIRSGENDIWRLDICLSDVKLGSILRTVNLLCEDGTLIEQPDGELVLGMGR